MIHLSLFLIHFWIGSISCAVYHIVPSPSHDCPVESCLTLSSFATNVSQYIESNTLLLFQPGNHVIHSKVNIAGVVNFSMISIDPLRAGITCENDSEPRFIFDTVQHVHVKNLRFFECIDSKLFTITASSLVLVKCTFENNVDTGMINAASSNISITQSTFNNIRVYRSSKILKFIDCNVTIVNSTFVNNICDELITVRNSVYYDLGSITAMASTSIITGCEFRNNHRSSVLAISSIIGVYNSDAVSICDTKFISNEVAHSLEAENSVINTDNCTFKYNHGSAMDLSFGKVNIVNSVFNNNEACVLKSWRTIIHIRGSEFKSNSEKYEGGAICSSGEMLITFSEVCTFADNQAEQGGAIYLDLGARCFVESGASVIITNNTASGDIHFGVDPYALSGDGGGIYLGRHSHLVLHSNSTLMILENKATENGGGIYMSQLSSINLGFKSLNNSDVNQTSNSTIYFFRNRARQGGGLYLESNSVLYISPCLNNVINFVKNSASYGGAVYVFTTAGDPVCFFQSETLGNSLKNYNFTDVTVQCSKQEKPFNFSLNRANYSGFSLYKKIFSNCSIDGRKFREFELLNILSDVQTSDIGSSQVQVCFCGADGNPDCTKEIEFINIKTGERLIIEAAIADRGNHIVSGSIESEIRGSASVRDDQMTQDVRNGCTALFFNIYSFEASQRLVMLPRLNNDSMHVSTVGSERTIRLNFLACISCPIGFQQIKDDAKGCDCVCDEMMLESLIISCNYMRETITKRGTTAWITYLSVKNSSGYLTYPYCPMNYCIPPDETVEINLNIPNGADAQCANNRSRLLCGTCSSGLSLSLGSSRCLQCHTYWPGVLVVIIIASLLAGVILVASLLILNLTVAVGTLNGLIFYANIVATSQYKFFPSKNFITVFVSWFNLELGIDTCFFDGMDFYWKTWIQLAFSAYILLLVVLVIVLSECSVKFSQIVGKKNPVATLDTLILLSYVKFLRTVILAFSYATLYYPDGSHHVVWWPDPTVGYFSGKHTVLWIVAAIISLAGLFYTIVLLFWQWLLYYQHKFLFRWIQSQRLRMFVEPYHAPYAFKHRYWTGLLLLVRVIAYVISATDHAHVSSDRGITLLAIGIIAIILLVFFSCRPYKSWPVEVLEIICYANIAGLCLATFYTSRVGKNQEVVGYISGTISLILFLIVLTYHVVTQLFFKTQLGQRVKNRFIRQFNDSESDEQDDLVTTQDSEEGKAATYSEIEPPPRRDVVPLSHFVNLRSRRSTTDSVSGSTNEYEENELIEQVNSFAAYTLMN